MRVVHTGTITDTTISDWTISGINNFGTLVHMINILARDDYKLYKVVLELERSADLILNNGTSRDPNDIENHIGPILDLKDREELYKIIMKSVDHIYDVVYVEALELDAIESIIELNRSIVNNTILGEIQ